MIKSVDIVLKKCLDIKQNERVLIITDSKLYDIAKLFFKQSKKITNNVKLIKIPIPEFMERSQAKK